MKQEDVTALAALLNSSAETVSQALESGKVSELITGFKSTTKMFSEGDYNTLIENTKRQAITELDKTKLPRDVFEYVKGSVLEVSEKKIAKKYGISDYQDMDSLVEAIITTKSKTPSDEETKELKKRITDLEADHKAKLESVSKTFENRFIDTELRRVVGELPIDAEGSKLENQQEIVMAMAKAKFAFALDGDKTIAMKDGKAVTDSKLDPVPIKDVISDFAKDYVNLRLEQGGRGDKSSTSGSKVVNWADYCEKNGLKPNSIPMALARKDLESKGFTLE